MDKKEGTDIGH